MNIFKKIKNAISREGRLDEEQRRNALKIFEKIKASFYEVTDSDLKKYEMVCKEKILEFAARGQLLAKAKVEWLMEVIGKEHKLVTEYGIKECINRETLGDFVEKHPTRVIQICDLTDYERSIPYEVGVKIEKVKDFFDSIVIVYTDHTKPQARRVEKAKDPIAFGLFIGHLEVDVPSRDENGNLCTKRAKTDCMSDRLYHIGSWEDEMCNLTLDRMIQESAKMNVSMEKMNPKGFVHPSKRMENISEPS